MIPNLSITLQSLQSYKQFSIKKNNKKSHLLIDCIQIHRRFLLTLSARQESNSGHCWRYSPLQSGDSGTCDILGAKFARMRHASSNHVGFQQCTFKEDVVVGECLVDKREHSLCDLLATDNVMVAVGEDLRLDNRYNTVHLTDGRVTGEDVGVFHDGLVRGRVFLDFQHTAPFREVAAIFFVLCTAFAQIVQTLNYIGI